MRAALLTTAILLASTASGASAIEVSREVVINAAPGAVWQLVGPFCGIGQWHPIITRCVEERVGGEPHRRLTTDAGGMLLEKLTKHDVDGMSYSYEIVESPLPVTNYRSTVSVGDAGDGKARMTWRSTFDPKEVPDEVARNVIDAIYEAGLTSVKNKVAP